MAQLPDALARASFANMDFLNDIENLFTSSEGRTTLITVGVFFLGLALALIVGGIIASKVSKRHIKAHEEQNKAAIIGALVDVATEASVWNALSPQEQIISDRAVGQIDIRVRLLPVKGAGIAADWASHQLGEMKRNSATFGYQLDPAVAEFRDRLMMWMNNPSRAHKIFTADLERWAYQSVAPEAAAVAAQDAWVAQQHHEQFEEPEAPPAAAPVVAAAAAVAPAPSEAEQLVQDVDALAALRPPQDEDDTPGVPKMF